VEIWVKKLKVHACILHASPSSLYNDGFEKYLFSIFFDLTKLVRNLNGELKIAKKNQLACKTPNKKEMDWWDVTAHKGQPKDFSLYRSILQG
jgi:hypothetical protein